MSFYIDLDKPTSTVYYKSVDGRTFELPQLISEMKEVDGMPLGAIQLTEKNLLAQLVLMIHRSKEAIV